ncbi:MAG TPA: hypothetical protein VHV82_12370 [Sporichthyaceae bacterium]|jgi:hypothetical protein|nr:hypothetical protein [Sporichthyaceae bacterium]
MEPDDGEPQGAKLLSLEITLAPIPGCEPDATADSVALCLDRLRAQSPQVDLLRKGLLGELRSASSSQRRQDLLHSYVAPLLEAVALIAVAAAPASVRVIDAVQEASLIFVQLVEDESVPDPLLTLANTLRDRLTQFEPAN